MSHFANRLAKGLLPAFVAAVAFSSQFAMALEEGEKQTVCNVFHDFH